jgi:hypothetical protein
MHEGIGHFMIIATSVATAMLFVKPRRTPCPECRIFLPGKGNVRSLLWGGWICANCGCEVDRRGQKISPQPAN